VSPEPEAPDAPSFFPPALFFFFEVMLGVSLL